MTAGLHIEARGAGPAVVFTHGFGRTGDTWAPQVEALAGDHHVVTWDLRGHGRSDAPAGLYTREDALADLGSVVDLAMADGGGPVLLVGHSLGGYLSLAYTLGRPETVRGLALLSTGPGFRNPASMEKFNRGVARIGAAAGVPENAWEVATHRDSMVIDRLAEITRPLLMMCGAGDRPMYTTGAKVVSERVGDGRLVEIAGAGHEPHVDRPDEVIAALRSHEALLAGR